MQIKKNKENFKTVLATDKLATFNVFQPPERAFPTKVEIWNLQSTYQELCQPRRTWETIEQCYIFLVQAYI